MSLIVRKPNGLTLESQCLPSMYVESFEGVVNINLKENCEEVVSMCVLLWTFFFFF